MKLGLSLSAPSGHVRFDIRRARRRIVQLLVVLAGLNALGYVLLTRPAVVEYRRLQEATRPDFDALREREESVARLEAFSDGLRLAESEMVRLNQEVLSTRKARMVEVQAELDALCRAFHIDLDSVNYSHELLLNEGLDRLEMVVPLQGGYSNLRQFLQAVESSDKFLLVERVALARGQQGGRLLDLNIALVTYFTAPQELIDAETGARGGRRRRA